MGSQEAERKTSMILLDSSADNLKEMCAFLKKLSVILFFSLLAFPLSAFCQVDTAWVRYYNGPGDKTDEVFSSTIDDSGNVFTTGYSGNNSSTGDFVTIKYDRNGNQLWRKSYAGVLYNQNTPNALTLDKDGNTYITGMTGNFHCVTIKYDPDGNQLWNALYPNGIAIGGAVATDEQSNVYVSAIAGGDYTNFDCLTLKYDSNGNQLWAATFDKGPNYSNRSYLISPDKNGNVFVSGYSENGITRNETEWVTIKYDSLGNQVWMKQFSTWQGATVGAPVDMKLDAVGNVYLTGGFQDSGIFVSYATVKYDPDGNQVWVARYRGRPNAYDFAIALVLDSNANVYVTGYSYGEGTANADIATIKYDSNGNQLWIRHYDGPVNGYDGGSSITIDSIGNIYVAGQSEGINSSLNYVNYVILKYDSSGILLWDKRYEGLMFNRATEKLLIDRIGNVYLAGTEFQNSHDFVTIKYSPLPTLKGDLNLDGVMTLADVVLMLNFAFNGDPFPAAPAAGDLNCNGAVSSADFVIMLQYFFLSVPLPC